MNDKEQYWIDYYDSFFNGYNESVGGLIHCNRSGSSKEKVVGVITDLKTTNMNHREIAEKWNISTEMVQGINTGRYWKHNTLYPIQKNNSVDKITNEKECPICGKEKTPDARLCKDCYLSEIRKNRPSREELLNLIKNTSFVQIGKMFGVSDNAVRKWCKSYDLPYRKKDIKNLYIN